MSDLAAFMAKLDAAIDSAMQNEVAKGAKEALRDAAYSEVYGAYTPIFFNRKARLRKEIRENKGNAFDFNLESFFEIIT